MNQNSIQESKQRILSACIKLFIEKGYHKATLAEILSNSSTTSSTFQNIFRSKDGVLLDLTEFMFKNQFSIARSRGNNNIPLIYIYAIETSMQLVLALVDVNGFSKVIKDDEAHNCMFVMPQCPKDSFWCAKVESILSFIEQIKEKFSIDENKIYLMGLSMGGYGTWFTAMAKPDLFAAIAPICGGGMAWNASVLTMPVWAFHSSDDPVVSVFQSDETVEKLKEFNNDVSYSRFDGLGHNSWEKACDMKLLDWLLSKSK